jgi:hypothetical protein
MLQYLLVSLGKVVHVLQAMQTCGMEVSGQRHAPAALSPGKELPKHTVLGSWVSPRAGLNVTE